MLLSKKTGKKIAGVGMAMTVLATSASGIIQPLQVNATGNSAYALVQTSSLQSEGDGKSYISYKCTNSKIKVDDGDSGSSPVYVKSVLKFTIRAEFSDTDADSNVYYQIADKGSAYDDDAWKICYPTITGLFTRKTYTFALSRNLDNKVVYIKAKCDGRKSIIKTIPFTLDQTKPVISGVKNRVTYTKNVKIKFSDALSGVKSATLNGAKIKTGKVVKEAGDYKIVVTDKAGNKKTLKFTIDK